MFGTIQRGAKAGAKLAKLHSIAAVMRGRTFEGSFHVGGVPYTFTYRPAKAEITGHKLELTGVLRVIDGRPNARVSPHSLQNIKATLLSAQGGIGSAPQRRQSPPDIYAPKPELPVVESTGSLSFCGALFFKLSPLAGRALGVTADMSRLQLNVRLAPRNDTERELQGVFSSIVDALYGRQMDRTAASAATNELNKLIATG